MATKPGKVNTATLMRGRSYTQRSKKPINENGDMAQRFLRGVPTVVEDEEFLSVLESQMDVIIDGEGEQYDKPRFMINRNVDPPEGTAAPRSTRLAPDRKIKKRRRLLRQEED